MPAGFGTLFKQGTRRRGRDLSTMRILRVLLEQRSFSRRCALLMRILRSGPFDFATVVFSRESSPGTVEATVLAMLGDSSEQAALQEALSSAMSPLVSSEAPVPRFVSAEADPFAPGTAFLRRWNLVWLVALPLRGPKGGELGRPYLLLGGVEQARETDELVETVLSAWALYRQAESLETLTVPAGVSGGDGGLAIDGPEWEEAPAALAVVRADEVLAMNRRARQLLAASLGETEQLWRSWLAGTVRRLLESDRVEDEVIASRRRRIRLEIALGPRQAGGRLVALRDVTARAAADDRRAATISTLSHELRTPLASMKNSVQLVLSGEAGRLEADQERFLSMTMRNIDRLDRLIGDLLDVSRAHAGRLALRRRTVDVSALLREAMAMIEAGAEQRNIGLDYSGLPDTFPAHVDGDKLVQMVHNTVGNALKYTEDGGKVRIWIDWRTSPDVTLEEGLADRFFLPLKTFDLVVEDNGTGMSRELLENLCYPFSRGAEAEASGTPGTGLGLHITRALVEAHGGRLLIESEVNIGTTVRIVLPRDPESEQVLVAAKALAGLRQGFGGDDILVCLDARRPDREPAAEKWQEAEAFVKKFMARFDRSDSEETAAETDEDDETGLQTLAGGLWAGVVADMTRLEAGWEVARGRPDCPARLVDLDWIVVAWPDEKTGSLESVAEITGTTAQDPQQAEPGEDDR